jgi:hypothetical protein
LDIEQTRKGGSNPMFLKMIAVTGFVVALSAAPAFALGGGGRGHGSFDGSGAVSGSFDGGTFTGQCANNGTCTGTFVQSASEPLAALAVGLGLLGAPFLRRR